MEYLFIITSIAVFAAGFLLCAHLIARRRKCSTAQVILDTLTIQRGKPGEEQ